LLGHPAHRDQRRAHLHPRPFDAAVDRVREAADLGFVPGVLVEVRLGEQHAAEQQRGVDRRKLDPVRIARAGLEVEEVVVEAVIARHAFGARALRRAFEETERRQRAVDGLLARDVAALDADAVRRQREADRGDARERLGVRIAVGHEAGVGIGRFPEVVERAALDVVEERRQRRTQQRRDGRTRWFSFALAAAAVHEHAGGDDDGEEKRWKAVTEQH